jgi:hypothetical protein
MILYQWYYIFQCLLYIHSLHTWSRGKKSTQDCRYLTLLCDNLKQWMFLQNFFSWHYFGEFVMFFQLSTSFHYSLYRHLALFHSQRKIRLLGRKILKILKNNFSVPNEIFKFPICCSVILTHQICTFLWQICQFSVTKFSLLCR